LNPATHLAGFFIEEVDVRFLVCIALLALAIPAEAHTINTSAGKPFTFDASCCSENDCELVPDGAITETTQGWSADYVSTKTGRRVIGVIPFSSTSIKQSPDGRPYACESATPNDAVPGAVKPRCIYPPIPAT
jgi:hypothetical protein